MPCILRTAPLLLAVLLPGTWVAAQTEAPQKATCKVDTSAPSEADIAFFRHDLKKAETLYAAAVAADPADDRSREHQIDSLIGQHRLDEANKLLNDWAAADPEDSYALAAAADIRFAEGDWLDSYALNLKALKLDPCNADAFSGTAEYEALAGYHATAHSHFGIAHKLEPNQEDFYREWIGGLPEPEQIEAFKKYFMESKALSEKQHNEIAKNGFSKMKVNDSHCELVSSDGPAVIPMVPMYNRGSSQIAYYGLEIAFNGHKRTLQIDTGASGFLLTHSAGATISMPAISKFSVGGFGDQGPNDSELQRADSVRIGGLEFHNCAVNVLSNYGAMGGSHIEGNRMDNKDGLVGSDIFDRYIVTLDYIKHEVRLAPLPLPPDMATTQLDPLGGSDDLNRRNVDRYIAPSMKNWTQIYRRGHDLLMPTRLNGTKTRFFIIDTGNFVNLIDINTAKEITKEEEGITRIQGLSGTSKLAEAGGFIADFAGIRLPVKSMDAMDLSSWGDGIAGFLGYPTLEQLVMHIDYRDNLVLFEAPKAKHL